MWAHWRLAPRPEQRGDPGEGAGVEAGEGRGSQVRAPHGTFKAARRVQEEGEQLELGMRGRWPRSNRHR
jgi:hypothetical protein